MIVNIGITGLLITVGMIFVNEVQIFWDDRTTLGNVVTGTAVVILIGWIAAAIYQVWQ